MTLILCLESSWFEISFIKIFSIGELLTWKSPTKFPFEMWKIIIIHWKWMNKTYREMRDSRLDYIQSTGDCPLLCLLTSQLRPECSENMTQQLCLCLATPRPPSNQHWHWYLLIAPTEQSRCLDSMRPDSRQDFNFVRWQTLVCWSSLNSHPVHFISMVERDLSKLLSDQNLIDFFLKDSSTRAGLL